MTGRRFIVISSWSWTTIVLRNSRRGCPPCSRRSRRHRHVPLHRPSYTLSSKLARVRLGRGVQQAPGLEFVGFEQAARLADEIVDERRRVFSIRSDRPRLRPEHLPERRRRGRRRRLRCASNAIRSDAQAPFLRHADPGSITLAAATFRRAPPRAA